LLGLFSMIPLYQGTYVSCCIQFDIMEKNHRPSELILKYVIQTLTEEEKLELDAWIGASPINKAIFESLNSADKIMEELEFQGEVSRIARRARKRFDERLTIEAKRKARKNRKSGLLKFIARWKIKKPPGGEAALIKYH